LSSPTQTRTTARTEPVGFFKDGRFHHPIIEGECKAISRWGRAFWGPLLASDGENLTICINGNVVTYAKSDLLWWGTRWTGEHDADGNPTSANLPAPHPDGLLYPAAFPDGCGPINGGTDGKGWCPTVKAKP